MRLMATLMMWCPRVLDRLQTLFESFRMNMLRMLPLMMRLSMRCRVLLSSLLLGLSGAIRVGTVFTGANTTVGFSS